MSAAIAVIKWFLQCLLFVDLDVGRDNYKIGQTLPAAHISHPLCALTTSHRVTSCKRFI